MNWLILVAITVLLDPFRIYIDNYVADVYFKKRQAVAQKFFYGCIYVVTAIVALIIMRFNFFEADLGNIGLLLLAGALCSFAGIPYFRALELDDSTNIGIFIQLAPVMYLILGWLFLGETFSPIQLLSFAIIISAPLLIVFTAKKRSRKVKLRAVFFAFLYVVISVIGNLLFVKVDAREGNILHEIVFFVMGKGLMNCLTICCWPKWRRRFRYVLKTSHGKMLRPMVINFLIGITTDFTYRTALAIAPTVALASATSDAVEPISIFFIGILLSIIWPKFGREKLDKKTVIVHLVATIIVAIGVILQQVLS